MHAQHPVGADLPQHQIGLLGDHGSVEAREHVGDFLAAHAAVQNGDFMPGKMSDEFLCKAARIGGSRRTRAHPVGHGQ
jgi:hypothetical protein